MNPKIASEIDQSIKNQMQKLKLKPILTGDFQKGLRAEFISQNEILEQKFEEDVRKEFDYLGNW